MPLVTLETSTRKISWSHCDLFTSLPGTSYLVPGIDVFIAAVPAIPPIRDDGNHIRVLVYSEQKIKDIPGTWYLVGTLGTTHFSDLRLTQPIIYVYSYS